LRREFEEYGTKIRALNDRGDETPEGELTDGILDQLAKYERAKIAERTRRGMMRKAREGRVVVARPAYGFRYNDARDAMVVCAPEMAVVEKGLRLAADGLGQHAIQTRLFREGVPSPTGKPQWDWRMIKNIVHNDAYRPHTFGEISALLSPEVVATLDPDKEYGVQWYNRRRVTERTVSEPDGASPGGRRYRKTRTFKWRPKEKWVAAPVPVYVRRSLVDLARGAMDGRSGRERKYLSRPWELRGLMTLAELGSKLEELESTRRMAEVEIAALAAQEERVEELGRDRDALLELYAGALPEALDRLDGEEQSVSDAEARDHSAAGRHPRRAWYLERQPPNPPREWQSGGRFCTYGTISCPSADL
jgi:hypothetical protein